jgi:hypothetical protein
MPPGARQVREIKMGLDQLIPEEKIRARSYAIWDADGRPEGRCEEYWYRAIAELEAELMCAWLTKAEQRDKTEFVMPRLPISQPVCRREAGRLDPHALREAA